jgi:hypothetical protein
MVFNVGGTPVATYTGTSIAFNVAPSLPSLTLAGTLNNSTSSLTTVVASQSVLSITSGGVLSLTGASPALNAPGTWNLQVGGVSVLTVSSSALTHATGVGLAVSGNVGISGAASATKFQVFDALSNPVLTVNTSTDLVTVNALTVSTFTAGHVLSDSSGNLSVANTSFVFNNTTLTGTTSVTGIMGLTGAANISKLYVLDASSDTILNVDTVADLVTVSALNISSFTTAGAVVTDGSGNLIVSTEITGLTLFGTNTVIGTIGFSGANSSTKLQILDASSVPVLTVSTVSDVVIVSALTITGFGAGPVISNGSGNLSVSSTLSALTLTNANTVTGTLGISGGTSATKLQVLDGSSNPVLTVNTSTDTVTASALTVSGFTVAGSVVSNASGVLAVSSTLTGITLAGTTGLSGVTTATSRIALTGTGSTIKLQVLDASSLAVLTVNTTTDLVTVSALNVSSLTTAGPVVCDGSGNILVSNQISGVTLVGVNTVTGSIIFSGANSTTKLQIFDAGSNPIFTVNTSTDIVTANALTVTSFSTAGPVVSNSSGVLTVSSTLTGITLAGVTSISGAATATSTVSVSGSDSATKLQVLDVSSAVVLGVNTITDIVTVKALNVSSFITAGPVVTDGSGNILVSNQISGVTLVGTNTVTGVINFMGADSETKLNIVDASSNPVFTVDTVDDIVYASALNISSFTTAGAVVTDGSGNLLVSNEITGITLFGVNTVIGTINFSGVNSATKLSIVDASSNPVLMVNTLTDIVYANALNVMSFTSAGHVVSDSSGNLSVISNNFMFSNTTLSGTTSVTGTLGVSGTASAIKLQVLDASSLAVLTVNTATDTVTASALTVSGFTVAGPVVSSSSGVLTVSSTLTGITLAGATVASGTLTASGTASTTKLLVQDAGSNAIFTVNTSTPVVTVAGTSATMFVVKNSSTVFAVNTSSNAVTTKANTLDDGSGNMLLGGTLNVTNSSVTALIVQSGSAVALTVNAATSAVTTKLNTLDNGSGGATIVGPLVVNSTAANSFVVENGSTTYLKVNAGVVTSTNNTLDSAGAATFVGALTVNTGASNALLVENGATVNFKVNGGAVTTQGNTLDNGSGASTFVGAMTLNTGSPNAFVVKNGPTTYFTINGAAVTTLNNTLDSGLGAATFVGALTINTSSSNALLVENGATVNFKVNGGIVTTQGNTLDNGSGAASLIGPLTVTTSSTAALLVKSSTTTALTVNTSTSVVTTLHNTLDDGSGNVAAAGTMTVTVSNTQALLVKTSTANVLAVDTVTPAVTVTGTSATMFVVTTGTSAALAVNTSTGTMSSKLNTLDNGSGGATFAGTMAVNNALTINTAVANSFVVENGSTAYLKVNAGAVTTEFNTLDNGSGASTFVGAMAVDNALTINTSAANSLVVENGATTYFKVNAGAVTTTNNTLDNGSGAATFVGALTVNTSAANSLLIENGATTYLKVNAGVVTTTNNTLDNGSGASTFNGTATHTVTSTTALVVQTGSAVIFTVDTSTPAVTLLGSSATMLVVKSGSITALTVNTSTGAVTTSHNTLDNGSGVATVVSLTASQSSASAVTLLTLNNTSTGAAQVQFGANSGTGTISYTGTATGLTVSPITNFSSAVNVNAAAYALGPVTMGPSAQYYMNTATFTIAIGSGNTTCAIYQFPVATAQYIVTVRAGGFHATANYWWTTADQSIYVQTSTGLAILGTTPTFVYTNTGSIAATITWSVGASNTLDLLVANNAGYSYTAAFFIKVLMI